MEKTRADGDEVRGARSLYCGRVLLVDDDRADLEYHARILQNLGLNVTRCEVYSQAAHMLGDRRFDFVVVSQVTPEFEGRLVLERASEIDRSMPVVVLTRAADMDCYLDAIEMGAADYLEKPVSGMEMLRIVESHLRRPATSLDA